MLKKFFAGLVTAVLALGGVALVAGPASAHHNTISASVVCDVDGTYKVTWSVTNSEKGKTEVIKESNLPSVVAVGTTFGFSETKTFAQKVTTPANLELTLLGFWDGDTATKNDDVYSRNSGSLSKDKFPTGCLKVTAEATPSYSVCNGPNTYTDPTYTLKQVEGVKYIVDGNEKAAGTYPATNGTTVNIVAQVKDPKYQLTGTTSWTLKFVKPENCVDKVEPALPKVELQVCTGPGSYNLAQFYIPKSPGVLYTLNDQPLAQETWYPVEDGVTALEVVARPDSVNYYVFKDGSSSKSFPLEFNKLDCLERTVPKEPTVVTATCDVVNNPGVVPEQSYTLVYVPNLTYWVSTNGADAVATPITKDTKFVVTGNATIVVTAKSVDPLKYAVDPTWSVTKQFTDPGDCRGELTPLAPTWTNQFCDDTQDPRLVVDGSVSFTPVAGLTYFLDGAKVDTTTPQSIAGAAVAGEITIKVSPGPHSLTVTVDNPDQYKVDPNVELPFTATVTPGECLPTFPLVTPATSSKQVGCFSAGSYTLSNDLDDPAAITWTVNGSQVTEGKYTVTGGGTVNITATANGPDYAFETGVQTSWTYDFKKPAVCDIETLALTGQNPTGLLIAADLLVVAGLALFAMRAVRRGRSQTA